MTVVICTLSAFACSEPSKGPFTFKIENVPENASAGGEPFMVKVTVSPKKASRDFQPWAYEFKLKYDPSVLRAEEVSEGGYLKGLGVTSFCPKNEIDQEMGQLWFACASSPGGEKGDSTDEIALIRFSPIGSGSSTLEFVDEEFADRLGESLRTESEDGRIDVQ